jgi:hypothetical protein
MPGCCKASPPYRTGTASARPNKRCKACWRRRARSGIRLGGYPSQPALAYNLPDAAPTIYPHSLISKPTPAYTAALAGYLANKLAPWDPSIAAGIARRAIAPLVSRTAVIESGNVPDDLSDDDAAITVAIACPLLADRKLKRLADRELKQSSIENLAKNLKSAQLTCPPAPAAVTKTK